MTADAHGSARSGPLSGLRVLDLSRVLAGPFCAMLLGDAGADVIKVEPPWGDDTRAWGPPYLPGGEPSEGYPGDSAYFASCNKNKRDIVVDLRSEAGRAIVRRLATEVDVVIENFKPGTLEKWGLGYEAVLRVDNPRLIYASISGFGRTGPDADLPAYDVVVGATSGVMSLTGEPAGTPMKVGIPISDLSTGTTCAVAILASLWGRERTGTGQRVDISLFETQLSWLINIAENYFVSNNAPRRYGNAHPNIVPYALFEASDRPLFIAVGNDRQFQILAGMLDRPELSDDPKFATNRGRLENREELTHLLNDLLSQGDAAYWIAKLRAAGIPASLVKTVPEVLSEPQAASTGMVTEVEHPTAGLLKLLGIPYKFDNQPGEIRHAPPRFGQHTEEILREAGYSVADIERLAGDGIVYRS